MHSAPAVSYPVGRSHCQGWLVALTGLIGALAGLLWHAQADLAGWRQWLFALTLLGACVVAIEAWRRSPRGSLRWDGQAWHWSTVATSVCGLVTVHLDGQFFLLLCLRTDSGTRIWLWPERRTEVARWSALRWAVFARAGTGQAQAANASVHGAEAKS